MMRISLDPLTGKRKFTGLPSLKQSQHYPEEFGVAVGQTFASAVQSLRQHVPHRNTVTVDGAENIAAILWQRLRGKDVWADARVGDVIRQLRKVNRGS